MPEILSFFAKNSVIPVKFSPKVSPLFIGQLINPETFLLLANSMPIFKHLIMYLDLILEETLKGFLNFNGTSNLRIKDEKSTLSARYAFADKTTLVTPQKEITMPDKAVSFTLKNNDYESVKKLYTNLNLPDIAFKGEKGKIKLEALDKKNSNSNLSSINVGETDLEFTAYIKAENMKLIPGDYDVALSKMKIAHFINKKVNVQYWIALEADSAF